MIDNPIIGYAITNGKFKPINQFFNKNKILFLLKMILNNLILVSLNGISLILF